MNTSASLALRTAAATHPRLGWRVFRMAGTWAFLGSVMGAIVGMEQGTLVGFIACMIAGSIEFAPMGAFFGLIGGTPRESVVGAVWGLVVSVLTSLSIGQARLGFFAAFGLTIGALTGATFRSYLRLMSLPVFLLKRIVPTRYRHKLRPSFAQRKPQAVR